MRTRVSITLLSASLTAATAFAAQAQTSAIRPNYDAFYAQARAQLDSKAVSAPTLRELTAKQQRSASGYKSSYDQLLGTTTFLWGNDLQAAAVGPVATKALPAALGKAYLSQKAAALGLNRSMIEDAKLLDTQLTRQGGTISRYQQRVGDIEVFNRRLNVLTDGSHRLVAISGSFQPNVTLEKASGFSLDATRAIRTAIGDLGGNITPSLLSSEKRAGGYLLYGLLDSAPDYLLERPVRVKQVYFPLPGSIEPAYYLEVVGRPASLQRQDGYSYVISATTGEILFRNSLIAYEGGTTAYSYRVFADADGIHQPYDTPLGNTDVPFAGSTPDDVPVRSSGVANLITLVSGPISTGDAWLPDDATTTTGNNADAYLDSGLQLDPGIYFTNQPFDWPGDGYVPFTGDLRSEMTGDATFDYPVQADDDPSTDDAKQAAIVNLFYMNNWLHDWWYDHGFDEVAGNAQSDNYGRGGVEGDPIQAQGQDGGGRNNANMLTPSDGGEPRMQMYLFDGFVQGEVCQTAPTANCPSTDDGEGYVFSIASFGPDEFDVTGDVVLVDDGSEPVTNGCNDDLLIPDPLGLGLVPDAPLPSPIMLAGKIALIDRGECSFTTKEQYAMLSGADAMVVINNGEGNPITMGNADIPIDIGFTTDDLYTTPAVMISKQDGETLKALLAAGETVSLHLLRNPAIDQDGTFDNQIIAHEFFHYVSNRLVGDGSGLSNNQGRSMGEGWSDIAALMLSVREDDLAVANNALWQGAYPSGYYVLDAPYYGIRRMPYSASFDYNFLTFHHIEDGIALEGPAPVGFGEDGSTNSEVHNAGEVWANTLFHAYTMLLNRPELSFAEAQARMKDYVICGLKMTPSSPTYTEARDGVLACAMSADLADFGVMAKAFALRGMGIDAVSPDRSSTDHAGVVESFISLSAQAPTLEVVLDAAGDDDCDHDGILDAGETGVLRFSLLNNGAYTPGQTVTATLGTYSSLSLESGDAVSFTAGEIGETTLAFVDVALADDAASPLELLLTLSIDPPANADETIEYPETVSYSVLANYDGAPSESDDLESPELAPLGWTASSTGTTTVWELTDQDTYTGSGTGWFAPNLDTTAEIQLITPAFVVPEGAEFTFSFDHYYSFEVLFPLLGVGYDGGVIDVSVDGGDWVDAEEFGASFSGGYTGNIQANSRAGYVGANGSVETETLDFGTSVAGQSIRLRFTVASDSAVGDIGWIIDNVNTTGADPAFTTVSAEDGVCGVAPTPTPTATPTPTPTGTTTPTPTPTGSVTPTPTPSTTATPTPTPTGSVTPTPSTTATPTPTSTPTPTPTGSVTPGPTASPTPTPTGTVTPTPTASVTPSPTPTAGGSSNGGSGGGSMGFGLLGLFAVALGLRRRRSLTA